MKCGYIHLTRFVLVTPGLSNGFAWMPVWSTGQAATRQLFRHTHSFAGCVHWIVLIVAHEWDERTCGCSQWQFEPGWENLAEAGRGASLRSRLANIQKKSWEMILNPILNAIVDIHAKSRNHRETLGKRRKQQLSENEKNIKYWEWAKWDPGRAGFSWCDAPGLSHCEAPFPVLLRGKNRKGLRLSRNWRYWRSEITVNKYFVNPY